VILAKAFADENFLRLKLMVFRDRSGSLYTCQVEASVLQAGDVGKCLGYWWIEGDLVATKSVEKNIAKARHTFFHYGSIGMFQGGIQSPLIQIYVRVLCEADFTLGGENWIMTEGLILVERLEKGSYQKGCCHAEVVEALLPSLLWMCQQYGTGFFFCGKVGFPVVCGGERLWKSQCWGPGRC